MPTDVLLDMGAKFIIAVNVLTEPQKSKQAASLLKESGTTEAPNILNTLIQSINIMEYEIIKLKTLKADIIISPDVSHIEAFEFYKGKEAIQAGYKAATNILPRLQRLIGKH